MEVILNHVSQVMGPILQVVPWVGSGDRISGASMTPRSPWHGKGGGKLQKDGGIFLNCDIKSSVRGGRIATEKG